MLFLVSHCAYGKHWLTFYSSTQAVAHNENVILIHFTLERWILRNDKNGKKHFLNPMYDCGLQLQVVGVRISKSLLLIAPAHGNVPCDNEVLFWILYL